MEAVIAPYYIRIDQNSTFLALILFYVSSMWIICADAVHLIHFYLDEIVA